MSSPTLSRPAPPPAAPPTGAGVVLHDLARSFPSPTGPVHAVRGVDLTIERGQTVALLGPNGAGKSTTIEMLLGLTRPERGAVEVLGRTPDAAVDAGLVSAMLQTGGLLHEVRVRELVALTAALYPRPLDVDDVLELAGLEPIASRWTTKLSGGQVQRVRFALALVGDPELLVLDEPTVAMDVEGRRAFWETMRGFAARGKTVVFATHYLEEADAFADRIVLMARGRVVGDGSPNEVKALVGRRTIRASLGHVDLGALRRLPGVELADRRGQAVVLSCSDSDAAIRALLQAHPDAHGIEIEAAGLEQAFLELTADHDPPAAGADQEAVR